MELLRSSHKRSRVSDMAYVALNIGLALALLFIAVAYPEAPWIAVLAVAISKWRVFGVRPRFWVANVIANLVDVIVSLSVVVLLYAASGAWMLQLGLTAAYIAWLLWVKPRSKRHYIAIQAGVSIFVGITALMTVSYGLDASITVIGMWLIGFSAARHLLGSYDESHSLFFSFMWGLFFAELGWLAYHWTFVYSLPGFGNIKLVQVAIIATAMSFVAERAYDSRYKHGTVRFSDVLGPGILSVVLIVILVTFFNGIESVGSGIG